MAEMTIAPVVTHGFFVDGRWMEDGDIVEVRAPYDDSVIARVVQGRREHAEAAIAAADRDDPYRRLEDLEAHRDAIPDGKNNALIVMAAGQLLPSVGFNMC